MRLTRSPSPGLWHISTTCSISHRKGSKSVLVFKPSVFPHGPQWMQFDVRRPPGCCLPHPQPYLSPASSFSCCGVRTAFLCVKFWVDLIPCPGLQDWYSVTHSEWLHVTSLVCMSVNRLSRGAGDGRPVSRVDRQVLLWEVLFGRMESLGLTRADGTLTFCIS